MIRNISADLWIAEEWQRYSDKLAEWAMEHLVNRRDVWSQYTVKNGEVGVVMLPIKERRKLGADMVTMNKLRRHFSGRSPRARLLSNGCPRKRRPARARWTR